MFSTSRTRALSPFSLALAVVLTIAISIPFADAGYDIGWFDLAQNGGQPQGWLWVPDSTSDGSGVQYLAFTANYAHGGPAAPLITETVRFQSSQGFASLQAFLDHIVATVPYVSSTAELTVHRMDVTTVQP